MCALKFARRTPSGSKVDFLWVALWPLIVGIAVQASGASRDSTVEEVLWMTGSEGRVRVRLHGLHSCAIHAFYTSTFL